MEELQNYAYAQQACLVQRTVGLGEAVTRFYKNYANFNGRASRSEYWWVALVNCVIGCIPILGWVYMLIALIPSLALVVRRLHDTGRSGWWFFIALIPVIGAICLFIFELMASQEGENEYGPMPNVQ